MSTMEKVIGIAVIIIIAFVFLVVMIVGLQFLLRWRQKGINPMKKFPRNPKGGMLSNTQQRALNVGAILAETNSDFCDSLQTSKAVAKRTIGNILKQDWEINSAEDAIKRLEDLKYNGHRHIFNNIFKNASVLPLAGEHSSVNPRKIYEQTGFSLLDKRLLMEYENEAAIAEKHIDLIDKLINAPSFEDIKKYQALFGDEKTFSICIQLFYHFYEQCCVYTRSIVNLEQTLTDLQKNEILGNRSELESLDATAWDMGRMVNVARYSYDCGYICESQAWEYIFFAEQESSSCYADWAAFGKAYVICRAIWGGNEMNLYATMRNLKSLKEDKNSPWMLAPLH